MTAPEQPLSESERGRATGGEVGGPTGQECPQQNSYPQTPIAELFQPSYDSLDPPTSQTHSASSQRLENGQPLPLFFGGTLYELQGTGLSKPHAEDDTPETSQVRRRAIAESKDESKRDYEENLGGSYIVGKEDFVWSEDLSENGQKLFLLLLGDAGYTEHLAEYAKVEGVDLEKGLNELRSHDILDEIDPKFVGIVKRKL